MKEQRQESEYILVCQRSLRLKWECTKDLCCHIFSLWLWQMSSLNLSDDALSELLYADNLVLMSATTKGLRNKFLEWKKDLDNKGLKVNLWKTTGQPQQYKAWLVQKEG